MVKVNHSFSFTWQPENNQWAKVNIELLEIDSEKPIGEQLEAANKTLDETWEFINEKVAEEVRATS